MVMEIFDLGARNKLYSDLYLVAGHLCVELEKTLLIFLLINVLLEVNRKIAIL